MNRFLEYLKYVEELNGSMSNPENSKMQTIKSIKMKTQKAKRRRRNAWITGILVTIVAGSAIGKVIGLPIVAEQLSKVGAEDYMIILGVIEIFLGLLFISPKTLRLSFILLSCYFSGAIAAEITHGGNFIFPLIFLGLVWVASFAREPSLLNMSKDIQRESNPWNLKWMTIE